MDFSKLQLFSMMKQRMAYGAERQAVIAQNIANANTPGYRAQDLKPLDFKEMAMQSSLPMAATKPGHLTPGAGGSTRFQQVEQKETFETAPTQNNVVLEEQMMMMQANNTDYQTTTSLYRRMTELFRISLGSSGS